MSDTEMAHTLPRREPEPGRSPPSKRLRTHQHQFADDLTGIDSFPLQLQETTHDWTSPEGIYAALIQGNLALATESDPEYKPDAMMVNREVNQLMAW